MADGRVRGKSRVTVSSCSIVKYFEDLPDPRHHRHRLHRWPDLITIAVCGVIVGCAGPTAIRTWPEAKENWLKRLLPLPNGLPLRDCIRRVLTTLKPEAFQACFTAWVASLMSQDLAGEPIVAIDGKTLRRSHDQKNGLAQALFLCSGRITVLSGHATRYGDTR